MTPPREGTQLAPFAQPTSVCAPLAGAHQADETWADSTPLVNGWGYRRPGLGPRLVWGELPECGILPAELLDFAIAGIELALQLARSARSFLPLALRGFLFLPLRACGTLVPREGRISGSF